MRNYYFFFIAEINKYFGLKIYSLQFEPGCLAPWPRHVPFGQSPMSEGGFYFTNWTTNILD